MKNKSYFTLTILLIGGLTWFGLPWWWTIMAGFAAGAIFPNKKTVVFGLGMAAGTLLWGTVAYYLNFYNAGNLSGKIGNLLQGITAAKLLWATGAIGGLLGGVGALSGLLFRQIFEPDFGENPAG